MNVSMNHSDQCALSASLMRWPWLTFFLILQIIFGSASAFGNAILMVAVWQVSLFHSNLRWLLMNLSFNLFWYGSATALKAAHFLFVAILDEPCWLVISSFKCKIWEMAYITPFLNTIYSILAVGLERLFCTFLYRTYENSSRIPWIACFFIPAIWIGTLGNQAAILANLPHQILPVCISFLFTPKSAVQAALWTNTVLELLALILISLLYVWNLHKRDRVVNVTYMRRDYNLAARFQIMQNVDVNKLLLPSIIVHACAHVPYLIFFIFLMIGFDLRLEIRILLFNITYAWLVVYGIAHVWLAFSRHPQLKSKFQLWAPNVVSVLVKRKSRKIGAYNPSATTDAHFDMLHKMWAVTKPNGYSINNVHEQIRAF